MDTVVSIVRVIHVLNAILMAWPFYALVAVNQRGRLGPPLGDRADTYMENIIKSRTVPCFFFQGTALVSGIALVALRGLALLGSPVLAAKFVLLLVIIGLLAYVHLGVQPRIDALFAGATSRPIEPEVAAEIARLRLRRKRIASWCLFIVLTIAMLGLQVWNPFSIVLTLALVAAIGLFAWRAYRSLTPYGWV